MKAMTSPKDAIKRRTLVILRKLMLWKFALPHTHVLKVCVMKICLETLTTM